MKKSILTSLCLLATAGYLRAQEVVVYPAPDGAELNGDFTVSVRQKGAQAWKTLPTYIINVDEVKGIRHSVENASMSFFDFSGEVEVAVQFNRGDVRAARVRPLSYNIVPEVKGNTLSFCLDRPRNLSVEVNGDIFHNLHLFANPTETFKPDPKSPDVIYFGAGVHHPKEGKSFRIPSGKTVYVSGSAILMGQILIKDARDVKVLGRGIIDRSVKAGIQIANSRNIYVEGVVLTQIPTGGSDSVAIRNVKSISYYGWGDGMNVFASSNVLFDGVFCRNSDDCTTVYATRKGFTGGCRNITMQNSTLWADVAHPIFIGLHGNTPNPDIIEDLRYVNIDILDHKEKQIDYQGCLAINAGDNNLIRNVRFEDIRIEDFRQGQLVNLRIFYNPKYCTAPGRGIENVLFKNISYSGSNAEMSIIAGYDAERKVKNIRFENLQINGQVISDNMLGKPVWYKTADMARFFVGEHTENVRFVKSGELPASDSIAFDAGSSAQTLLKETETNIKSPDGAYEFTCYQKQSAKGSKQLYYTLSFKGRRIIEESELGVLVENKLFESALGIPNDSSPLWGSRLTFTGEERSAADETWQPAYGERSQIRNRYNELVLKFQKGRDAAAASDDGYDKRRLYSLNLLVRAYNEGVAFRYAFPEASNGLFLHIVGEQTQLTLPEGTLAYYERWAQGPYSLLPLRDWKEECERPLTLQLANGLTLAVGEAGMVDYARMKFRLNPHKPNTLQASIYDSADIITPYATPWRFVMAAEKPTELLAHNDFVLNLNPPCEVKDVSWIKPGKAIRVQKLTQEDAKKCVDFAAERGLQYVHLDAGWYGPEMKVESDATTVDVGKDLDIPALTAYAASKHIGVLLYVNQRALARQLDDILPLYQKWGVKGIKFGFVHVGNQHWTTWLHNAVKKCADYQLLVDIHDEYRPTGFSRTYPNLLTQEGIRGNEEMPDATHNTTLPFTRFVAGAGDYTICYYDNRIKTTHAHQLALAAVYYSPLQLLYWYDRPDAYHGEPEIAFFDKVKTVWDDTKVLDGAIGEYILVARKSGDEWFVGGITNTEGRDVSVPLDFLDANRKYTATVYTDDDKVETRTKVAVSSSTVDSKTVLKFSLKASGGCAIYLKIKN